MTDFGVGQVEFFDVIDGRRGVAAERFEIGRGGYVDLVGAMLGGWH